MMSSVDESGIDPKVVRGVRPARTHTASVNPKSRDATGRKAGAPRQMHRCPSAPLARQPKMLQPTSRTGT